MFSLLFTRNDLLVREVESFLRKAILAGSNAERRGSQVDRRMEADFGGDPRNVKQGGARDKKEQDGYCEK